MQQYDWNSVRGSEQSWWDVGHALNEASVILANPVLGFTESLVVGLPIARIISPGDSPYRWRRALVAEMLYAFAVENWLKGLLVAGLPRASEAIAAEIQTILSETVPYNAGEDTRAHLHRLLEAFDSQELQGKTAAHESQRADENKQRAERLTAHNQHDLGRLAAAAGIAVDTEMMGYLKALSLLNQFGRYPLHSKENGVDLEPFVGNADLRTGLNAAIRKRYDDLR